MNLSSDNKAESDWPKDRLDLKFVLIIIIFAIWILFVYV